MRKLYRFKWDVGRMGTVRGIFTADENEIAKAIGESVSFGEILGKHSDVYGTLEEKDLTVLTDDPVFIAKFDEYGCESGYNPLDYLSDEDEDEDSDAEENED